MGKFTLEKAVRSLTKKRDCLIKGNVIKVLKGEKASNDLGLGSLAKIDFLVNYCFFVKLNVKSLY